MNRSFKKTAIASLLAAGALVAGGVQAQTRTAGDLGFYAGLGAGEAEYDNVCGGFSSCDDKDRMWKLFGGYNFTNMLGVELGYTDLGRATASSAAASSSLDVTGLELVGVARFPVTPNFSLFAKAGAFRWDADSTSTLAGSSSNTGTDWTYGVGVSYNFTRNLAGRLEWQQYQDVGPGSGSDVSTLGASIVFKF